jgi:hypothetical protein
MPTLLDYLVFPIITKKFRTDATSSSFCHTDNGSCIDLSRMVWYQLILNLYSGSGEFITSVYLEWKN